MHDEKATRDDELRARGREAAGPAGRARKLIIARAAWEAQGVSEANPLGLDEQDRVADGSSGTLRAHLER